MFPLYAEYLKQKLHYEESQARATDSNPIAFSAVVGQVFCEVL